MLNLINYAASFPKDRGKNNSNLNVKKYAIKGDVVNGKNIKLKKILLTKPRTVRTKNSWDAIKEAWDIEQAAFRQFIAEEEAWTKEMDEYFESLRIKQLKQQLELQMRQREEEKAKIQLEKIDEHIACNIKFANIRIQQVKYETYRYLPMRFWWCTDRRLTKVLSVNEDVGYYH